MLRPWLRTIFTTAQRAKSITRKERWASERKKDAKFLAVQYFDSFYAPYYGEKWPSVRLALLSDGKYCAMVNNFADKDETAEAFGQMGLIELFDQLRNTVVPVEHLKHGDAQVEHVPDAIESTERIEHALRDQSTMGLFVPADKLLMGEFEKRLSAEIRLPLTAEPPKMVPCNLTIPSDVKAYLYPPGDLSTFKQSPACKSGSLSYYLMDAASLLPVIALDVQFGDHVLDMCAAPGGKALAILQTLKPGLLVCNDNSLRRFNRLRRCLNMYSALESGFGQRVVLKQADASTDDWDTSYKYDKVLVDAPCTSDRLSTEEEAGLFKPGRSGERQHLPLLQVALLQNGVNSLKPGGHLVYSTCTLSPVQNDNVVQAVVQQCAQSGCPIDVCDLTPFGQRLTNSQLFSVQPGRYGLQVVPNLLSNFGPLYISKLVKGDK